MERGEGARDGGKQDGEVGRSGMYVAMLPSPWKSMNLATDCDPIRSKPARIRIDRHTASGSAVCRVHS
jgi:hypothetical protein